MNDLHQPQPDVSPCVDTGLILAGLPVLRRHGLACPTVDEVLAATGSGRTRAYEIRNAIVELLPALRRPVGRPKAPDKPEPAVAPTEALSRLVVRFVFKHPGAVSGGAVRRRYSDSFRTFILETCEQHRDVAINDVAAAAQVHSALSRIG